MRLVLYSCVVLFFGSCATVFNGRNTKINIHSATKVKVAFNKDTFPDNKEFVLIAKRQKKPISVTVFNDTSSKVLNLKWKYSNAFVLNIYPSVFWLFAWVDFTNPKRFDYPRHVYVDLTDPRCNFSEDKKYLELFAPKAFAVKYHNQFKIAPFRTVSDMRGVYVSYERIYRYRHSTQVTAAYIFDPLANTEFSSWKNTKGYSFAIEQKYFRSDINNGRDYYSFDFNYSNSSHTLIHYFRPKIMRDSIDSTHLHLDTVTVKRKTYTFCIRYGAQWYYKRLVFDLNAGLGIRYKDITHLNKLHPDDKMQGAKEWTFADIFNEEGKRTSGAVVVSFKIGYMF
jgi:hypothetical protein